MTAKSIHQLIGNTPLLLLQPEKTGLKKFNVYAKLEYMNPFGSVKDRLVMGLLDPHVDEVLKNAKTVLESSSGNTAKALASYCNTCDISFKTITNRIHYPEVRKILQLLGVDITEVSGYGECPDITDPDSPIAQIERLANQHSDKYFLTNQYFNSDNPQYHYKTTGKEIYEELGNVDYFFAFLGTCGSSFGAGSYLKEKCGTKTIGVVSHEGQIIPGGRTEIETRETSIFHFDFYHDVVKVSIDDAIQANIDLIRKFGVLAGPTSGGNYAATLAYCRRLEEEGHPGGNVVFIACDRFERYVSYYEKYASWLFNNEQNEHEGSQEYLHVQTEYIKKEELEKVMDDVMIIDTRSNFAYQKFHLPGAMNIPLEILDDLINQGPFLSFEKKIVLTCRGGYSSIKQCKQLLYMGYDACILEGGLIEWKKE